MLARDSRFDGKFFVGVKTTGIYCRPICPARPKRENVRFFARASEAEAAGYRPCLRCRPECAPSSPAWRGKSASVQRALRLIAAGEYLEAGEEDFAGRLGMSSRHLRRLFAEEVGQTPKQIADMLRLDFARTLVVETSLPILTIAMTAGFSSLRRFNDAFHKRFHRTPSRMRRARRDVATDEGVRLSLAYRPPFDWQNTLRYFDAHRIIGLESVTDGVYERVFRIGDAEGLFTVTPVPTRAELTLTVSANDWKVLFTIVRRVRKMFDLDSDPVVVANELSRNPVLGELSSALPGLRVARGFDAFETAIGTILGQLVSIRHGRELLRQLVEFYGVAGEHIHTKLPVKFFPTPSRLSDCDLKNVKTTEARRQAIRDFSRKVAAREIVFADEQSPKEFREAVLSTKGLGHWSAEYMSLRALGDPDAFPATDLILKRALESVSLDELDSVKPWRSYAAVYLWNEYCQSTFKAGRGANGTIL